MIRVTAARRRPEVGTVSDSCQRGVDAVLVLESAPRTPDSLTRLVMIIRNSSKTALLTEENTADQRRVSARDHLEPTAAVASQKR